MSRWWGDIASVNELVRLAEHVELGNLRLRAGTGSLTMMWTNPPIGWGGGKMVDNFLPAIKGFFSVRLSSEIALASSAVVVIVSGRDTL